jgi:hypothetical protein
MGANTPEEYGEFYSWSPDAVAAAWGGQWRMPTKEEAEELRDNCVFVWGEQNGVGGMYVIGPNGNAIFMPAVYIEYVYMGDWEGEAQYMENSTNPQYGIGEFWTSTQGADGKVDYMGFSHEGSTWARREQGDVREWATFTFPDGQESERRFEKEHLPRMYRSADLHWRKSIRPVRR